ncbi:MAG: alpha/beta hydrolase [Phycisphaerales bacterium]|nr:MAG: alpha/beta hydrolase [Phycisphaerales bacterium]
MKALSVLTVVVLTVINTVDPRLASASDKDNSIRDIPPGVRVIADIAYREGASKAWRLDLAMPEEPGHEPRPAIVFVHGGGWRSGDKRAGNFLRPTLEFAAQGYVCITVNYRLLGEAPMPACVEDVKCAVRWLRAHAGKYNVDPERVGAYGNSAGAHLVAMLGLCPASAGLEGDGSWRGYSSMVQAVVASATPANFLTPMNNRRTGKANVKNAARSRGGVRDLPEQMRKKLSPITYVSADAPPFLLVHEESDRLVGIHQADEFVKALREAGAADVTYMRYTNGSGHGVFSANIKETGPARQAFFERTLRKKNSSLASPAEKTDTSAAAPKRSRSKQARRSERKGQLKPTYEDVTYGPHERNVLDFYQAKSQNPTPLAVYIHGGGFRGGSKKSLNRGTLQQLLDAGISVAALQYRLVPDAPLPAAHRDSLRALQFIRSRAKQWNIDETRVGAFGGSAGAQICMWLAFHDEMADPSSRDPIDRESSRLACVATSGGQTSMEFDWWKRWIPGYEQPHRDRSELFGEVSDQELARIVKDISALSIVSADDPPIFMSYGMKPGDPVPSDPRRAQGWKVHHVMFGIKLREKMDELGVAADLKYPGAHTTYDSVPAFFIAQLKPGE